MHRFTITSYKLLGCFRDDWACVPLEELGARIVRMWRPGVSRMIVRDHQTGDKYELLEVTEGKALVEGITC